MGKLNSKNVVCMFGRFHYYEGYDFEELVIPIRVFHLLGVKTVILTNAAGAVNPSYSPGEIMIIKDYIKLMGASPLRGPNVEKFGPRFIDMTKTYAKELRDLAKRCAEKINMKINEGVYYFTAGPQLETASEVNALRILGADAVGMSTVTEAITAVHCGMKVLGLALMTNMAAGVVEQPISPEEVYKIGRQSSKKFKELLREIIKEI